MMRVEVREEGAFLTGVSVSVGAPGPVRPEWSERGGGGQRGCHGVTCPQPSALKKWACPQKQSTASGHKYKLSDPSKAYDPSGVRGNGLEGRWEDGGEV